MRKMSSPNNEQPGTIGDAEFKPRNVTLVPKLKPLTSTSKSLAWSHLHMWLIISRRQRHSGVEKKVCQNKWWANKLKYFSEESSVVKY